MTSTKTNVEKCRWDADGETLGSRVQLYSDFKANLKSGDEMLAESPLLCTSQYTSAS